MRAAIVRAGACEPLERQLATLRVDGLGSGMIVTGTIVDVAAGVTRPGHAVVIQGDRIVLVSPSADVRGLDEGPQIALDGFIVPGLIDTHVHLGAHPGPDAPSYPAADRPARMALHAARNLALPARAGVTTVRDLGGGPIVPYTVRRAWHDGALEGRGLSSPAR